MKRITVLLAALLLAATPSAQSPKPLDIYFIDVEGGQATLFVLAVRRVDAGRCRASRA